MSHGDILARIADAISKQMQTPEYPAGIDEVWQVLISLRYPPLIEAFFPKKPPQQTEPPPVDA